MLYGELRRLLHTEYALRSTTEPQSAPALACTRGWASMGFLMAPQIRQTVRSCSCRDKISFGGCELVEGHAALRHEKEEARLKPSGRSPAGIAGHGAGPRLHHRPRCRLSLPHLTLRARSEKWRSKDRMCAPRLATIHERGGRTMPTRRKRGGDGLRLPVARRDILGFPPTKRSQRRAVCSLSVWKKNVGAFPTDACIERQRSQQPDPGHRVDARTAARNG